jgi:hypothetical protein
MSTKMLRKLRAGVAAFFSNAAYATWAQTALVVISIFVAVIALRHTDRAIGVTNSTLLAQRYFLDHPSGVQASLVLRTRQYEMVQEAKKKIPNYDDKKASQAGWEDVFVIARPLVTARIKDDPKLRDDYVTGRNFFTSLFVCVESGACDRDTAVEMLGEEARGFYLATCSYMERTDSGFEGDEDSQNFVAFLVDYAHFRDSQKYYFCRTKVDEYLKTNRPNG